MTQAPILDQRNMTTPFRISLGLLIILTVVMPNSYPTLSFLLLISAACFVLFAKPFFSIPRLLIYFWMASLFVTILYMLVGALNGATLEALKQTMLIYIISPILWTIIMVHWLRCRGIEQISRLLVLLVFPCAISVVVFFFLFLNYGPSSTRVFISSSNIDFSNGTVAATMHVYGSMIFFAGGIFAAPNIFQNRTVRLLAIISVITIAATSGRGALIIAIFLGLLVSIISSASRTIRPRRFVLFVVGTGATLFLVALVSAYFAVDLTLLITDLLNRILNISHSIRGQQVSHLARGIADSSGFGMGHGIGVDYIRSEKYPWRYEAVWVATLYRVGLLGAIAYVVPFIYFFWRIATTQIRRELSTGERFLFGAFTAVFAASATNPYLEAFAFQWMYILPISAMVLRNNSIDCSIPKVHAPDASSSSVRV